MTLLHTSKRNNRWLGMSAARAMLIAALCVAGTAPTTGGTELKSSLISPEQWQQLEFARVRTVREFSGVVWVGGDDGLAAFEGGRWRRWRVADGLPVDRIAALDMDRATRELWIGTMGGGLVRFSAGRFDVSNQFNSGLAGDLVSGVAVLGGRVYAATNGGVCGFEPIQQEWNLLIPRRAGESQQVAVELITEGDTLVAFLWPEGTVRWDAEARDWVNHTSDPSIASVGFFQKPRDTELTMSGPARPAVAILGPGTRRIDLPGARSPGKDPSQRNQPDIAAVRSAVDLARTKNTSTEVLLWQPAPGYAKYGWGLLEDDLVAYADKSDVVGLVTHVDEFQRYTAASITLMGIPAVNVALDPIESNEGLSPDHWIFQCRKDRPQQHRALLEFVKGRQRDSWLVVECDGEYETMLRSAWTKSFADRINLENVKYISESEASPERVREVILREKVTAVFLWGDPAKAMRVAGELKELRMNLLLAGGPALASPEFRVLAEKAGWSVAALVDAEVPTRCSPELLDKYDSHPKPHSMSKLPDALACQSFDGAEHLLEAVRTGPSDRTGLANTLRRMEQDIYGERHFEARRGGTTYRIAVLTDGQWRDEELTASAPTADSAR